MKNLKNNIIKMKRRKNPGETDKEYKSSNQLVLSVVLEDLDEQLLVATFKGLYGIKPTSFFLPMKSYPKLKCGQRFDGKIYVISRNDVVNKDLGHVSEEEIDMFIKKMGYIDTALMDEYDYLILTNYLKEYNKKNIIEGSVICLPLSMYGKVNCYFVEELQEEYFTGIPLIYNPKEGLIFTSTERVSIPYNVLIVESYYLLEQEINLREQLKNSLRLIK